MEARARAQRRALAVDVEGALAGEDVDDLVVAVEVVGRAPGRDVADELRHRRAAVLRLREQRELAAGRRRRRARRVAITAWLAVAGQRLLDEHGEERRPSADSTLPRRPARDEDAGARLELVRLAADGRLPRCPRGRRAPRRARRRGRSPPAPVEAQQALPELGNVKSGVTGSPVSLGLDAVLHRGEPIPRLSLPLPCTASRVAARSSRATQTSAGGERLRLTRTSQKEGTEC